MQFSLRWMLLVVTGLAILIAGWRVSTQGTAQVVVAALYIAVALRIWATVTMPSLVGRAAIWLLIIGLTAIGLIQGTAAVMRFLEPERPADIVP